MKNIYFSLLAFILLSFNIHAQPVITTASVAPSIGDSWEVTYMEYNLDVGPGGLNQTWDFSDVSSPNELSLSIQILDPNEIANGPNVPNADFVWYFEAFNTYNYYEVTDDSISLIWGASISGTDVSFETRFTDVENGLQFPLTFGDNYDYFSRFDQYLFGNYTATGERYGNVNVDGFGTVITPEGTFENVLRVIITQTSFGITSTQYAWMDINNFIPVLVYEESTDTEFTPSLYYSKPSTSTTNAQEVFLAESDWNAWYSRADHQVQVQLPESSKDQDVRVSVFDLMGKLLTTKVVDSDTNTFAQTTIALPERLQQDMLVITLKASGKIGAKKIPILR